jgi:hypothetical protein
MRSSILLAGAIFALSACTVDMPCSDGWTVTFLDRGEGGRVVMSGKVCDTRGQVCEAIPSFHRICPPDGSFCGDANAWTCLSPGAHFYRVISEKDGAAAPEITTEDGLFELPETKGSDCAARIHVNTTKPRIQLLKCDAGQFISAENQQRAGAPDAGALVVGD